MSGYTVTPSAITVSKARERALLQKPFTHETLVRHVCDALDMSARA